MHFAGLSNDAFASGLVRAGYGDELLSHSLVGPRPPPGEYEQWDRTGLCSSNWNTDDDGSSQAEVVSSRDCPPSPFTLLVPWSSSRLLLIAILLPSSVQSDSQSSISHRQLETVATIKRNRVVGIGHQDAHPHRFRGPVCRPVAGKGRWSTVHEPPSCRRHAYLLRGDVAKEKVEMRPRQLFSEALSHIVDLIPVIVINGDLLDNDGRDCRCSGKWWRLDEGQHADVTGHLGDVRGQPAGVLWAFGMDHVPPRFIGRHTQHWNLLPCTKRREGRIISRRSQEAACVSGE